MKSNLIGDGKKFYNAVRISPLNNDEIYPKMDIGSATFYRLFDKIEFTTDEKQAAARALGRSIESIFGADTEVSAESQGYNTRFEKGKNKAYKSADNAGNNIMFAIPPENEQALNTAYNNAGGFPNQNDDVINALMTADARYTMADNSLGAAYPEGTILALALKSDGYIKEGRLYVVRTSSDTYVGRVFDEGEEWLFTPENDQEIYKEGHVRAGKLVYPNYKLMKKDIIAWYNIVAIAKMFNGMFYAFNKQLQ